MSTGQPDEAPPDQPDSPADRLRQFVEQHFDPDERPASLPDDVVPEGTCDEERDDTAGEADAVTSDDD